MRSEELMPIGSKVRVLSDKLNVKVGSVGTVVDHRDAYVAVDFESKRDLQFIYHSDLEPFLKIL